MLAFIPESLRPIVRYKLMITNVNEWSLITTGVVSSNVMASGSMHWRPGAAAKWEDGIQFLTPTMVPPEVPPATVGTAGVQ